MLEQGPDFWCWFDTTQFSYHCVHPIHANIFSNQMLLHFSQIVPGVCTLVLFIIIRVCVCVLSEPKYALKRDTRVVRLLLSRGVQLALWRSM